MIGVDIVDVARLEQALARTPRLEARLFTPAERAYCRATHNRAQRLAGTLAAKEAVIKALRLGPLASWVQRIEVRRGPDGVPTAVVGDTEIAVSISHDGPVAVAVALAPR